MEEAAKILMVMGLAAIELWVAIPAGFAFSLDPVTTAIAAAAGAMLGAAAVVLLGDQLRSWLMRILVTKPVDGKPSRIRQIWDRYGIIGLGLLAPLLTGAPLGIAIGLSLGAPGRRLFIWTSFGIVFWSAALTLAGTMGLAGF
ncbi:MAG: small multi-drug export protein [Bacteroidetes bacterium]|nr:small multi-drug export protein [Bacteroidota bacterium]